MDEHVRWIDLRKLRRAVDSRHSICLDNSCLETSGSRSQSRGAFGIDITEQVSYTLPQSLQSERGRAGIDARRCLQRSQVRTATEVWIATSTRKEPKSAMQ